MCCDHHRVTTWVVRFRFRVGFVIRGLGGGNEEDVEEEEAAAVSPLPPPSVVLVAPLLPSVSSSESGSDEVAILSWETTRLNPKSQIFTRQSVVTKMSARK